MLALLLVMVVTAAPENPFRSRVEALLALTRAGSSKEASTTGRKLEQELLVAAKAKDKSSETLVLLGRAQLYLGDTEAAALSLDEAIKLDARDVDAQFYRGVAARILRAYEVSLRHFRTVTELAPKEARGWSELGAALSGTDDHAAALVALQKAIALDPKDALAHAIAGQLLIRTGKGPQGIALLEKALVLEPRDLEAAYNAGLYYQLNGVPKRAIERFEQVAKADAADWHVRAKLVQLNQSLGHPDARDRWRDEVLALYRAKKLDPRVKEFCREQFEVKGQRVLAYESFELEGERAVRFSFRVMTLPDEKLLRVISLGSYDFTTQYMRGSGELKANERAWHLDGYFPDNSHKTYGIFTAEPNYEGTRGMVVDVLDGKLKESSSTTPGKKP